MDRKYTESHPWITFHPDMENADPVLWMLLGEAQSKCKHLEGVLLKPEEAEKFRNIFLIKGVHATTAIEGNTLTEEQVEQIQNGSLELPKSKQYLEQEVRNALKAYNYIADEALRGDARALCVDEIKQINKMVLEDLELEDGVVPGEIRKIPVGVGRYKGAPAEDCDFLLEETCKMLAHSNSDSEWKIADSILKAITAHLYLAWIHPFGDGNGRTARLVEFKILISSGVPDIAAHLLSNHYNETRSKYYRVLDETSRRKSVIPFVKYALQGFADQLNEEIARIREIEYKIFWNNYIHEYFMNKNSKVEIRRRHMALDISGHFFKTREGLKISEIRQFLAKPEYMGLTGRTITRDVNALINLNILLKDKNRIMPNLGLLLALRPGRV